LLEQGSDPQDIYSHPAATANIGVASAASKVITNQLKMRLMIDSFRALGHQLAKIDPLELPTHKSMHGSISPYSLKAENFGYTK
jgi:2-oxoglutarate dehydrogenase complex dehydrogenase (E1) component-like enzyme